MSFTKKLERMGFRRGSQTRLLSHLYQLVSAGVPATDALINMKKIYDKKRQKGLSLSCEKMIRNSSEGKKIMHEMSDWFPHSICEIIKISEEKGALAEGLKNSIEYLNSTKNFLSPLGKCFTGIFYLIAVLSFIAIIGTRFLPTIGEYVEVWPDMSLYLFAFSKFIYYNYQIIIGFLIIMSFFIRYSIIYYNKKSLLMKIAVPFMPVYKAINSYKTLKIMSLLSRNGIGTPEIINILKRQHKKGFLNHCYSKMYQAISSGQQNMGEAMDQGLFSDEQINDLDLISRFVDEENQEKIYESMADITYKSLKSKMTILANVFNVAALFLTAAGILWMYGSYAMLATAISQ